MKKKKLIYDTYEKPPLKEWIILSLQHVFAMFGATILVPILVNKAAGAEIMSVPLALICSGVGTIIYIICTNGKSPVYLGSSFAFIAPIASVYLKDGVSGFATGIISVGLVYILFSLLVRFFGNDWIKKLLPPIVTGPMIIIIGLSLAPNAINQIGLSDGIIEWKSLFVATISFLMTSLVAIYGKGFIKVIPFLFGIIVGYYLSVCLGLVDFTNVNNSSFFAIPKLLLPFKDYSFSMVGLLTMLPIAIVSISEHIGDHMALSSIIDKDLIKDPGLDKTLLGDGLATTFAGLIGGPANTTYGENTSVVGMSKVASVWVIGLAAVISILLAFFGKVTALFQTIPDEVLGGVSLLLYGFISVNGLKVLIENRVDFSKIRNVIIASTMLILGLGGAVITIYTKNLSISLTGISLAAIVGILLNILLKDKEKTI
ncbi:MAG: uracil-xanthine permease [Bacilli bacterium]|nr:uracil-xanthine permease [Bacilli bacterium]